MNTLGLIYVQTLQILTVSHSRLGNYNQGIYCKDSHFIGSMLSNLEKFKRLCRTVFSTLLTCLEKKSASSHKV